MRAIIAAVLVAGALAALVGGWFATGWKSVNAEAERLAAAPRDDAAKRAALFATELGARIEELRAAESQRPYYEYQNLYHDPRGASEGRSVQPSPLARGPSDPLVAVHFQISPAGAVSVPTLNEEVPELSDPARAAADRVALAALEKASSELRPLALAAAPAFPESAKPRPRPVERPAPQQEVAVQSIDESAYSQNVAPNQVYQQVQQQQAPPAQIAPAKPRRVKKLAPPPPTVVEVRVSPFVWRTALLDGQDSLLALRTVGTPDGTLTQGFALSRAAIHDWLADRADRMPAALVAEVPDRAEAAPLPLVGSTWQVAVDPGPAMPAALAAGDQLRRRFLLQFIPSALVALLCGGLVVLLVARADRLARQRSGFAAAAAHELRTPLAGLALYGDMLAEGLGDPERHAAYARRIADEAARLGRVVGNVLGFTQLERRALGLNVKSGDAADAARQAADRMRPALEHAGVSLALELPDQPVPVHLDDDAVQRILQNLIDNAEKYSRATGDRVIDIAVRGTSIEVADRGPGVPRSLRRRLFRPFARGEETGAGPAGLGLGLALARAQARAMGGDLTYREREGGGSVFSLRLAAA